MAIGKECVTLGQFKRIVDSLGTWKNAKTAGEFYKADAAPTSTNVGKYDGYLYATRIYNAVWNDYAELFKNKEEIEPNHIAYADKDGYISSKGCPNCAVGIVSNQYGHLIGGNGNPDDKTYTPIALAGRVPLKVSEKIPIGSLVAANEDGTGRKAEIPKDLGSIVGKCIGPDPAGRKNYINVLVGGAF